MNGADDKEEKGESGDSTAYLPASVFGKTPPKAGSTISMKVVSVDDQGEVEVQVMGGDTKEDSDQGEGDLVGGVDEIPTKTDE